MELDLGWMKRGGVILVCERATGLSLYCKLVDAFGDWGTFINLSFSGSAQILISCAYPSSIGDIDESYSIIRIATKDECMRNGVEYIERPVSAEELKALHEDKEMLDFMIKSEFSISHCEDGYWFSNSGIAYACDIYPTPREAIRAAMKGGV